MEYFTQDFVCVVDPLHHHTSIKRTKDNMWFERRGDAGTTLISESGLDFMGNIEVIMLPLTRGDNK